MRKYKAYYFTTKKIGNIYTWCIRNKAGEVLQSSVDEYETKELAALDAMEHIDEMYY